MSYTVRAAHRLWSTGLLRGVTHFYMEPAYAFFAHLQYEDGSARIVFANELGINHAGPNLLAKDKAHTRTLLSHLGVPVARGVAVVLNEWNASIGDYFPLPPQGYGYVSQEYAPSHCAKHLDFPVYVKPLDGSQGKGIARASTVEGLRVLLAAFNEAHEHVVLVEADLRMPDYRVVVFRDQVFVAYLREPLTVIGDGKSSVLALMESRLKRLETDGRKMRRAGLLSQVTEFLAEGGLDLTHCPEKGRALRVLPISNLSAGGSVRDVTPIIHERWKKECIRIAASFDLVVCGIDLACADISDGESQYAIIEVNGSPGLEHFASAGPRESELVDSLYIAALSGGTGMVL